MYSATKMHLCLEIQGTRVNYKIVLSLYRYVNIIKYFDRLNFVKNKSNNNLHLCTNRLQGSISWLLVIHCHGNMVENWQILQKLMPSDCVF